MEANLLGVTGLIIIILILTVIKDGKDMNPPLQRRIIIDLTTILIYWAIYESCAHTSLVRYINEVDIFINLSLLFFFFRMGQLWVQINPDILNLFKFMKKKGFHNEVVDEVVKGDENVKPEVD